MKVIFIKDLKGQGKINDIKEVSDGYATNYLIKNNYAVKYTKISSTRLNNDIENAKKDNEIKTIEATQLAKKLEKEKITFKVNTGEKDKVFGNISTKQISEELNKKNYNIDKKRININTPLNTLGIHQVEIELYKNVTSTLQIELTKK